MFTFLYISICSLIGAYGSTVTPRKFYAHPAIVKDVILSSPILGFRLLSGVFVEGYQASIEQDTDKTDYSIFRLFDFKVKETGTVSKRPKQSLEIYEFEACPFCRKVREAVSILDLDVVYYPCPRGGPTFRTKVQEIGGKQQFPFIIDPNTKTSMYESDDIIQYLFKTYGSGEVPALLRPGLLTTLSCGLGMAFRITKGAKFQEAKPAAKPLVLWAYEGSPFCKIVRERLVELEIPHVLKSAARGSPKRNELLKKTGRFQVPYIEDPNTNTSMYESFEIIKYLDKTYAIASQY
jgi:glutathione S-transferase